MKKRVWFSFLPLLAALSVQLVCKTVKMQFATPAGEAPLTERCYSWNLLPVGYGNFLPMLSMGAAAVSVLLFFVGLIRKEKPSGTFASIVASMGFTLASWLLFSTFTLWAAVSEACLFGAALCFYGAFYRKTKKGAKKRFSLLLRRHKSIAKEE